MYTLEVNKNKLKIFKGVRQSTERPKIKRSGGKDTATTDKDLGMSCYIQVEYNVFFCW